MKKTCLPSISSQLTKRLIMRWRQSSTLSIIIQQTVNTISLGYVKDWDGSRIISLKKKMYIAILSSSFCWRSLEKSSMILMIVFICQEWISQVDLVERLLSLKNKKLEEVWLKRLWLETSKHSLFKPQVNTVKNIL